jgi:hypothetical protein
MSKRKKDERPLPIINQGKRPKIPLKPITESEKRISDLLWIGSIITLFIALFAQRFEITILFWTLALIYSMHQIRSNIADCFQKKYILKSLIFLPLIFIPKLVCEQLLARANIWWLNLGISVNTIFGFGSAGTEASWLTFFISLALIILLFLPCNYYEEYYFREKWYLVGIWALLHLFLGFSQFTVGEFFILCGIGIGFKLIYDKHGIQVSYPTHVFTNLMTVFIAIVIILFSV